MLYIFSGLPGVGKTTLARRLAVERGAVYLRIDRIEQAVREAAGVLVGPEGYVVAYGVAADNLRLGRSVVADSVNPLQLTRAAWRQVAVQTGTAFREIEVHCSDAGEHRRRVETREADIAGFALPTWQHVRERAYEPWDSLPIRIDTAGKTADESMAELIERLV